MGFFKKDYCVVFVGNLAGFPHSVSVANMDKYNNEARIYVKSSFGQMDYHVELLDATDHEIETIKDVKKYGWSAPAKNPRLVEDKRELVEALRITLVLSGIDERDIKQYDIHFDYIAGQFLLLCKVKI